jgi:Plasmid pRiA4b ORF-3-like protein
MRGAPSVYVYQFKIVLRRVSPMVWRRLLLRSDYSAADLHYAIQISMGWSDSHLHLFHIYGKDYGVALPSRQHQVRRISISRPLGFSEPKALIGIFLKFVPSP